MIKLFKIILLSMYGVVSVLFIRSLFLDKYIEIVEIEYVIRKPHAAIEWEIKLEKRGVTPLLSNVKLKRLPTDFKYIIKWSKAFAHYDSLIFPNGQQIFLDMNCTIKNCFITNDKGLLSDVVYFDAVLFDVENNWDQHPLERSPFQKYIFVAEESAYNFPVCSKYFDNYYNLTWSYKLDSDISNTYFNIFDKFGLKIGPKIDMSWVNPMSSTPESVKRKLKRKSKAAAWFVSNCNAKNKRKSIAMAIKQELAKFNMSVDIFGWCGDKQCPNNQFEDCPLVLQDNYYFYFSFENSMAEDYVTEKLLNAILHYTVPVVYGGANYSRFLPPGSYINAFEMDPENVAERIYSAIQNRVEYENYFRWHNYYEYKKAGETADVCKLCEILNRPLEFSVKENFLKWWNTAEDLCPKRN